MPLTHCWQSNSGRWKARWHATREWLRLTEMLRAGVALLTASLLVAACGGGDSGSAPTTPPSQSAAVVSLTVSATSSTIHVGETLALTLEALDARGNVVDPGTTSWSSATQSVATIDASGIVTALAPGRSTITASAAGKVARIVINVADVEIAQVVLSADSVALVPGQTQALEASLFDDAGARIAGRGVNWSSDRPTTATVSSTGVVSAVGGGVAMITASSGDAIATATVIVSGNPGDPLIVRVTPERASMVVGDTLQLTVQVLDALGEVVETDSIGWLATTSTGSDVASVSATGVVTALAPGTVIVEATAGAARGATAIVVRKDVDESIVVTFAKPLPNQAVGDSVSIYVSVQSSAPLDSVVATVSRLSRHLVATPVGAMGTGIAWIGTIDLSDLQFGPYVITATAYDQRGGTGIAAVTFVRNSRTGSGGSKPPPKNK